MENNIKLNTSIPAPNIAQDSKTEQTKQYSYNFPKVGVVNVPKISQTPISDVLALKKQENPKMRYKLNTKKAGIYFDNISSALIIILGLIAGVCEIKKRKM